VAKKKTEEEKANAGGEGAPPAPPAQEKEKGETSDKKKSPGETLVMQLQTLMQESASQFIKQNKDDAAKLGEDVVRAIFAQQLVATMPALMKLPETATVEMRIAHEENNAVRTEVLQIIAKAEREDTARVARIRGNASSFVGKLAGGAVGMLGTFLAKSALGL
jgi:hypothetical protein